MDESCSIQTPSSSCIKKNETTEVVSQKSNFEGSPQSQLMTVSFLYIIKCLYSSSKKSFNKFFCLSVSIETFIVLAFGFSKPTR